MFLEMKAYESFISLFVSHFFMTIGVLGSIQVGKSWEIGVSGEGLEMHSGYSKSARNRMVSYGGFHSHGGTPIAGWFRMEEPIKI